ALANACRVFDTPGRSQGAADELRDRYRGRPDLARPIAIAVELRRQRGKIVRAHACGLEESEGVAQRVRDEPEADDGAQRRFRPRREALVDGSKHGEDERL